MNKERDKARKIVNLLMEYYVMHEYSHINVDISIDQFNTKIVMEGEVNPDNVDIKELENLFTPPRMVEYDDYYEGLLNSEDSEEIHAVGFLMDDAYIKLNGDILLIKLYRSHL